MFEFRPPEPLTLLLEDTSGNYAAVTTVTVEAKKLLAGRTTLRGDEPVAFTFTVTPVAPATGWAGGWKATAPSTGLSPASYIAHALLTFPGGQEVSPCPFKVVAA
jgi:hypothetical protein